MTILAILMSLTTVAAVPASGEDPDVGRTEQKEQPDEPDEPDVASGNKPGGPEDGDLLSPANGAANGDRSGPLDPVSTFKPVLRYAPSPVYPREALDEGIGGSVLLEIDVDVDGSVLAVTVIEFEREDFAWSARTNARSFVFEQLLNAEGDPHHFEYSTGPFLRRRRPHPCRSRGWSARLVRER